MLDLYRSLDDIAGEAKALSALAAVRRSQGRWDEAAALYEESIALSRQADDLHVLAGTLHDGAWIEYRRDRFEAAEAQTPPRRCASSRPLAIRWRRPTS